MALAAAPASCWKMIDRTSAWKRSIRGMIPSVPTSAMIRASTGSFLLRCKRADRAYGTLVGGIEVGRICHDCQGRSIARKGLPIERKTDAMSEDGRLLICPENLHEGMRLGPIHYVVMPEQVRAFAVAVGASNP